MKSILNMHPFQLILLIVFALLAIVGLFLFANYTGFGGNSNKVGAVVIWGTLPDTAVQSELNSIISGDKSYQKVSYVERPAATFDTDLANAIASGNGTDLILINQEQLLTEESRIDLIPFSSAIPQRGFVDTYLPEDQLYLTSTGTYGVPYVLDPLVLYYNRTLLASAGVAVPPASWEAITGLAPTLTQIAGAQTVTQSTIPFGTYDNVSNARGILSLLLLQAGSTITQNASTGVHTVFAQNNSSSSVTPAQSVLNFYTQFSDPSRTVYSWNSGFTSDRQAFLAGNLAFYLGYASEEPQLKAGNPNLDFDMAQIPEPQTAAQKADYGLAYAFAIPKASSNGNGALAAALALANSKYVPLAASALSMAPAQRALLVVSPSDQYSPIYYPMALIAQGWLSPAPATTDSIFSAMITNVTSGRLTSPAALSTAAQAMDAALQPSS